MLFVLLNKKKFAYPGKKLETAVKCSLLLCKWQDPLLLQKSTTFLEAGQWVSSPMYDQTIPYKSSFLKVKFSSRTEDSEKGSFLPSHTLVLKGRRNAVWFSPVFPDDFQQALRLAGLSVTPKQKHEHLRLRVAMCCKDSVSFEI